MSNTGVRSFSFSDKQGSTRGLETWESLGQGEVGRRAKGESRFKLTWGRRKARVTLWDAWVPAKNMPQGQESALSSLGAKGCPCRERVPREKKKTGSQHAGSRSTGRWRVLIILNGIWEWGWGGSPRAGAWKAWGRAHDFVVHPTLQCRR